MSLKKFSLVVTERHANKRLDQVLTEWLPDELKQPVSKGKVRKLVIAGAVYLNRKRVRIASKNVLNGARIEVFVDLSRLNSDAPSKETPFEMTEDRVLFEDEFLIAVNKPPGLPTQPTLDEARQNLFLSVKKFLSKRNGVSVTDVYLGLHHRLDRDTSGVILFTKSPQANPGIAKLFAEHGIEKTYQAISALEGPRGVEKEWTVKNYLARSREGGKKTTMVSVRAGGDFAHTEFKLIQKTGSFVWVEARPKTGRMHQIRVHLSEAKMPILGDVTYRGRAQIGQFTIPRVMLHAAQLTFVHPIHQNKVIIASSLPEDFNQCLKFVQKGDFGS